MTTLIMEELQKDIDEILLDVLVKTVASTKERIIKGEDLSLDNVILLLLLSQHNHIAHLRETIT